MEDVWSVISEKDIYVLRIGLKLYKISHNFMIIGVAPRFSQTE